MDNQTESVYRILNCLPSMNQEDDWTFGDFQESELDEEKVDAIPSTVDLRAPWWQIRDQKTTGACVGFATADGVLRWHYVSKGLIQDHEMTSPRFIWMANKESDSYTRYPTTFIESAGTFTKMALGIARRFGCVLETDLPMSGNLYPLSTRSFYIKASRLRISNYLNLGRNLNDWKKFLSENGPILTRLNVDQTWDQATQNDGLLDKYSPNTARGGHAVAIVGYTEDHFIVRNSWGETWGDKGFAYASYSYAQDAFTEAYGAII